MWRADTCWLVTQRPAAKGLFDEVDEIRRHVACTVGSVTRSEAYAAMSAGHAPEYVLRIAHACDYNGEKLVDFHNMRWLVVRSWQGDGDGVELTIERSNRGVTPI